MAQSPTETMGAIAYLMMQSDSHKAMTLDAMRKLCQPPLDAGLAVTASAPVQGKTPDREITAPLGYALFARVSDEWDAKLRDTGFDLADLPGEAWTSGENQWLLDMLASQKAAAGFVAKAARAVFAEGSALNIRLRDAEGALKVGERTV